LLFASSGDAFVDLLQLDIVLEIGGVLTRTDKEYQLHEFFCA
jgi:hypothetical protein